MIFPMDDIKQRRQKSLEEGRGRLRHPYSLELKGNSNLVKLHVTPPSPLMVQELLSLQLRFLGQRRGQAYSESKSPSHNLHIIRFISSSDPHRKRIRYIRLCFRLPSNCQLECFIRRRHSLDRDRQQHEHSQQRLLLRFTHLPPPPSPTHLHVRK